MALESTWLVCRQTVDRHGDRLNLLAGAGRAGRASTLLLSSGWPDRSINLLVICIHLARGRET